MKLAVINDEVSQDIHVAAAEAAGHGFGGLEIRSSGGVPPHRMTDDQLRVVRDMTTSQGLRVAGFDPPALKCRVPRDDAETAAVRDLVVDAVRRAEILGAPFVRVFTFYREGDPDPRGAAKAAHEVLDGVPADRVPLLVETGMRTNSPTMRHTLDFLDALGDDRLGILWDPGNSVFSGWDPEPFPQDYALGRDRIRHVHVKDPDGRTAYVRLGDGDLPWPAILARLAEDGYEGWISLETHWRIGRTLTQRQRDEPWGEEFTSGGLEASSICMSSLREMARAVGATPTPKAHA
ncbi:sugar phosphate isomerase/epimerase family protein [Streptomyces sp. WMMC940]|uniref:sugar phosphate isomerase/epimerase family protein n=1 Tax=Streptomyces sp. WMMC940 TaxID=3015153 RepID=UPI0022B712BF|nr:sugar phosphate isomerase/epimerase family protein [Streptomyces sp. WMMC940]MCZ7456170.1 sugar phosphate isomerase/epimerase [Streptomyces sp. WMMC940]